MCGLALLLAAVAAPGARAQAQAGVMVLPKWLSSLAPAGLRLPGREDLMGAPDTRGPVPTNGYRGTYVSAGGGRCARRGGGGAASSARATWARKQRRAAQLPGGPLQLRSAARARNMPPTNAANCTPRRAT